MSGLAQGGQPSFAQIAPGGGINWNSGAQSVTASATSQASIGVNVTQYRFNTSNAIRITINQLQSNFGTQDPNYILGLPLSGNGKLQTGTTFSSFFGPFFDGVNNYYGFRLSQNATSNINVGETVTVNKTFKAAPTNNIYFQKASWEASGATIGTEVDVSDTRFPAGTAVQSVTLEQFGSTEYYDVAFSQTSDGNTITAGTTTVTFNFTEPPFAQPGETIFSFIANPGERSTLDLSFIKELTNTTLGGRGTFPNGPDVLAINVFKTSGNDTTGNIILRWSEAQA